MNTRRAVLHLMTRPGTSTSFGRTACGNRNAIQFAAPDAFDAYPAEYRCRRCVARREKQKAVKA